MTSVCAYNLNRAAIEYEKKLHASNVEMGQILEENIVSVAREIQKLLAEIANAEKMERAAAAAAAAASPGELFANHVFIFLFLISTYAYESSSAFSISRTSDDRYLLNL